jgi:transcriptional regulator with XRE-family HTH domain
MEISMADKIPFDVSRIEAEENLLIDYQFLIQERMVANGISRAQLSEKTGLSVARISQILSSQANPTVKTLARIFHALEETVGIYVAHASTSHRANSHSEAMPVARSEKAVQWRCLEETGRPARRQDTEMVAVVKRSFASNDNDGRNVFVMNSDMIPEAA